MPLSMQGSNDLEGTMSGDPKFDPQPAAHRRFAGTSDQPGEERSPRSNDPPADSLARRPGPAHWRRGTCKSFSITMNQERTLKRSIIMPVTKIEFCKDVGDARGTVTAQACGGKVSRKITFTRRQADGSYLPLFSDEGDLAQLGSVVWRVQEWINAHQGDGPAIAEQEA